MIPNGTQKGLPWMSCNIFLICMFLLKLLIKYMAAEVGGGGGGGERKGVP